MADVVAAAAEVQRLEQIVQSLPSATADNLAGVATSLQSIVAALGKAIPQSTVLPVTDMEEFGDEDFKEVYEEFMGSEQDGIDGALNVGTDQHRNFAQRLINHTVKKRRLKVRSKPWG